MPISEKNLRDIYRELFGEADPAGEVPETFVSFYPYVNVNNTIRVRDGRVFVRICTLLEDAPESVHRALAVILISKLLRKRVPRPAERIYREYTNEPDFRSKALDHKRKKGRKVIKDAGGDAYDLNDIFDGLNVEYFGGELHKPSIGWSAKRTFRRLGHYDQAHDAIIISKSLDSKTIPAFVVEYVVYHEMLHVKHPTVHRNGRRYSHTAAFKRDERKYDHFEEAEAWIDRNSHRLKEIAGAIASKKRYWGLFD